VRLSEFILLDMDSILAEWDRFASTQGEVGANMSPTALRDHAREILEAIVQDMRVEQTKSEQSRKSKGLAPRPDGTADTAAETHAIVRAKSGFDVIQLVAEYRALRASVLRLWEQASSPSETDLEDVRRFNEGIDQALAESIAYFMEEVNEDRNLFLGMLGHDFRTPLQTVQVTAAYLSKLDAGPLVSAAATRLVKSGNRMKALLDDLLDYNRTKLGLGISVSPVPVDLAEVFADELEQVRLTHPGRRIDLEVSGDVRGVYDPGRLHQLLGNLAVNALRYGAPDAPVQVVLAGKPEEVLFMVKNQGPTVDRATLDRIFSPLQRGPEQGETPNTEGNLGLGLFIAREIVNAHGGQIGVDSRSSQTVFTVRLPKSHPGAEPRGGT
jgi:signal transduction histidine kinase